MLFELSILHLWRDVHVSQEPSEILPIVDASGLPYLLGPDSTCIAGSWEQVMPVIRACHDRARRAARHVVTLVRIEEDDGPRPGLSLHATTSSTATPADARAERRRSGWRAGGSR